MANRYWVGGTGNWSDNTNHWSDSSGGSPGASKPTSEDNVYFDTNSFTTTGQTVTVNETSYCLDLDWTGVINSPTWAGTYVLSIYGSFVGAAGMTSTINRIDFVSTVSGKTIMVNGLSFKTVVFNGVGGGWTLQDNFTASIGLSISNGAVSTDFNISCGNFTCSNATASLILGTSILTCSFSFSASTSAGLTLTNSTIKLTGNTVNFSGGGVTYNNVELMGTPITIKGSNTFNDLKLTAGKTVKFTEGTTQTVTTLSGDGTAGNLITIQSVTAGTPFTISKASGTVTVNYWSIKDCVASGGATFQAYNSINVSGNSGWSFIYAKALTASVNSSATITKAAKKVIAASLTASTSLQKKVARVFTFQVGVVASRGLKTAKTLNAANTTVSGTISRGIKKNLTASMVVLANFSMVKAFKKALTATVNISSGATKSIGKTLTATVNTAGAVVKKIGKSLSGSVSVTASRTYLLLKIYLKPLLAFLNKSNYTARVEVSRYEVKMDKAIHSVLVEKAEYTCQIDKTKAVIK